MPDVLHTYNPKHVTVSLGSHIAHGFSDDSFISIDPIGDGTSLIQGPDGEATRSIDPTNSFTIKISLQQTSNTNNFLQKKYYKDQARDGGDFSITIKDILGKDKFSSPNCWVTKPPTFGRGKSNTAREWELACVFGKFDV